METSQCEKPDSVWSTIIIPILTLILTPVFAGGVVWLQLSREHEFQAHQHSQLHKENRLDQKLAIHAKLVEFNARLFALRSSILGQTAFVTYLREYLTEDGVTELHKETEKLLQSQDDLVRMRAEALATLYSVHFYFRPQVANGVTAYSDMIVANGTIPSDEIEALIKKLKSEGKSRAKTSEAFLKMLGETRAKTGDSWAIAWHKLIDELNSQLAEDTKPERMTKVVETVQSSAKPKH